MEVIMKKKCIIAVILGAIITAIVCAVKKRWK